MLKKALFTVIILTLLLCLACGAEKTTTPATSVITSTMTSKTSSISSSTTTSLATSTPPSTTTTTKDFWAEKLGEPQYGGELIFRVNQLAAVFDPLLPGASHFWYEHLFMYDWALDRDVWSYNTAFTPPDYYIGHLVETWEWQDAQTLIAHVRQGVHWENKPPVNGRELTANDIKLHYDRVMGLGDFKPNPMTAGWAMPFKETTVLDDHTVIFKFKDPALFINQMTIFDIASGNIIECPDLLPEAINDWKNANGTGAYILTDFVSETSLTMSRNPNYWGYDERFPKNKLPYADTAKLLNIPDISTAIAALRTGKIDWLTDINIQQSQTLKQSSPEIVQKTKPNPGATVDLRCDLKPFTDINVRKALQLAIDNKTIAESYYAGAVDGKLVGLIPNEHKGWAAPYDEWPQDLQEEYTYNPAKAKQLLADAGFPDGFKTNILTANSSDLSLLQVIKAQFLDIGVDMEIKAEAMPTYMAMIDAGKNDQMAYGNWAGKTHPPQVAVQGFTSGQSGAAFHNNDPVYDAMYKELLASKSTDEAKAIVMKASEYVLRHHWGVVTCPSVVYIAVQPYFKGFSGEDFAWAHTKEWVFPRLWVDQDLKKSMKR